MSISLLIHILFLFFFCFILAALEVQIEGESGWAKNLPTWRPSKNKWYPKLYAKIMNDKELTGYHAMIFSLVFLFLHYPYFAGRPWNWTLELTTLSYFFIITVVWDFLWFVINPHYDFMDFWHKKVFWHKKWFLHLPIEYWLGFAISALLYIRIPFELSRLREWLLIADSFIVLTLLSTVIADSLGIFINRKNKTELGKK